MSGEVTDLRLLEVQLEDLYGRLQQVKRRDAPPSESDGYIRKTRELLEISRQIRQVSEKIRMVSHKFRSAQREDEGVTPASPSLASLFTPPADPARRQSATA